MLHYERPEKFGGYGWTVVAWVLGAAVAVAYISYYAFTFTNG